MSRSSSARADGGTTPGSRATGTGDRPPQARSRSAPSSCSKRARSTEAVSVPKPLKYTPHDTGEFAGPRCSPYSGAFAGTPASATEVSRSARTTLFVSGPVHPLPGHGARSPVITAGVRHGTTTGGEGAPARHRWSAGTTGQGRLQRNARHSAVGQGHRCRSPSRRLFLGPFPAATRASTDRPRGFRVGPVLAAVVRACSSCAGRVSGGASGGVPRRRPRRRRACGRRGRRPAWWCRCSADRSRCSPR